MSPELGKVIALQGIDPASNRQSPLKPRVSLGSGVGVQRQQVGRSPHGIDEAANLGGTRPRPHLRDQLLVPAPLDLELAPPFTFCRLARCFPGFLLQFTLSFNPPIVLATNPGAVLHLARDQHANDDLRHLFLQCGLVGVLPSHGRFALSSSFGTDTFPTRRRARSVTASTDSSKVGAGGIGSLMISSSSSIGRHQRDGAPISISSGFPNPRGGRFGCTNDFPAARRAQCPAPGSGMSAFRHALANPTSEIPNRLPRVVSGEDHTRS